jgi:glycosyltransferase involved in cell wall biosynthesis
MSTEVSAPHVAARQDLINSGDGPLQGKRVAMVMFSFFPADPRPRRAAEALVSVGMKVDLICLAEEEDLKNEVLNGVDVRRISIRRSRGSILRYAFQYIAFLLVSGAIVALRSLTRGYDLVYVHNMPDILVLSGLIPKMFRAKVILDLHDPMPELMRTIFGFQPDARAVRLLQWLEKWSIALADSVITVNLACARLFTSRGCPQRKMNVVMNSPDERIFHLQAPQERAQDMSTARRPFVIMYHGSLVERNGLDLAVDALARIRGSVPHAELRVYGWRTPYLDRVMDSVEKNGLHDVVRYLGPRSLEQLVQEIRVCDVGVIPNHRNIFTELNTPTRIFEYLALGKPVIAPRAAGIRDYFDDASLLFFELGDAEDLAKRIEFAASHPVETAEVARRGERVYFEHNWTEERRRLLRLVARLLNKDSRVYSAGLVGRSR